MTSPRLISSLLVIAAFLLWTGSFAAGWFPLSVLPEPDATWTENSTPQPRQHLPLRIETAVMESKLIKRVYPDYSEQAARARAAGLVTLEIVVDELGEVASAKVLRGHPLLDESAITAVKQWRYSPTYLNGTAVPVITTANISFSFPHSGSAIYVRVDEKGNLKNVEIDEGDFRDVEGPVPLDKLKESDSTAVIILPDRQVPFAVLEQALRNMQAQGIRNLRFMGGSGYLFKAGHLFYYSDGASNGVQRPKLDIDVNALTKKAKASGLTDADPRLAYLVCVNEVGKIIYVERESGPEFPKVESAVHQAHVVTPGRRGNEPVPTAVLLVVGKQ
jgi:TonB family protein